jgi:biotin synthase
MSKLEQLLKKISCASFPGVEDLVAVLSLEDLPEIKVLFDFADVVRQKVCGRGILLRGIVEFSNFCRNACAYCGLNKNNLALPRYRLSMSEILESVARVAASKVKTVVLQSGEDACVDILGLLEIIRSIKEQFDMSITLSLGEMNFKDYQLLKKAGADRYLLKIETSNQALYESLHPGMSFENRVACLHDLKEMGFQTGSGNIVGLKGQTLRMIAEDILFFKKEDLDMVGIGPFIPHGRTPLKDESQGSALLTLKTLALSRIVLKNVHLPATTALGSLEKDFREEALRAGANVLMPNFTPLRYKKLYEIYPGKRCIEEAGSVCVSCLTSLAERLDRTIDYSRGDTLKAG